MVVNPNFVSFNDTETTEIYTLSLHDALPICPARAGRTHPRAARGHRPPAVVAGPDRRGRPGRGARPTGARSEEHTSEIQSRQYLDRRRLLEKKYKNRVNVLKYPTNMV